MTPAQRANIELAIAILEVRKAAFLWVTGGWSENKAAPGDSTEALEQARLALESGIPSAWLCIDEASMDTAQSLLWAKHMSRGHAILIVADWLHAPRVRRLAKKHGLQVEVIASLWDAPSRLIVHDSLWEMVGFLISFLPEKVIWKIRNFD